MSTSGMDQTILVDQSQRKTNIDSADISSGEFKLYSKNSNLLRSDTVKGGTYHSSGIIEKSIDNGVTDHLFTQEINLDHFQLIKVIGRGSFAKVYLAKMLENGGKGTPMFQRKISSTSNELPESPKQQLNEKFFALKVIKKRRMFERNQVHHMHQERKILTEVDHPFIVKLHYAFQTPDRLYFVLDYLNGGDLFFHMRKKSRFNEKEARFYAAELILALECLHNQGFVYRDLKPENILLDQQGHIRLADFGLSKYTGNKGENSTNSFCGTPQYLAPEVIVKKNYNKMVDWWGLGILIHEMVVGSPPYADANSQRVLQDIIKIKYRPPQWLSTSLKNLISGLLKKEPNKRLGSAFTGGVQGIKDHEFFKGVDWLKVLNKNYKPPIKPKAKNQGDFKHFDKRLLKESPQETNISPSEDVNTNLLLWNKMHFDEFTYIEGSSPVSNSMQQTSFQDLGNNNEYGLSPKSQEPEIQQVEFKLQILTGKIQQVSQKEQETQEIQAEEQAEKVNDIKEHLQ